MGVDGGAAISSVCCLDDGECKHVCVCMCLPPVYGRDGTGTLPRAPFIVVCDVYSDCKDRPTQPTQPTQPTRTTNSTALVSFTTDGGRLAIFDCRANRIAASYTSHCPLFCHTPMSSLSSASSATTNIFITGTAEGSLSFFDTRKLRQTPPLRCPGVLAVGHIGFEESSNAIVASGMSGVCAFHIHRSNARYLGSYNPPTMLTRPVAATAANEFAGLTAMHVLSPDVTPVVNAFVDGENKRVVLTTSSGRLCVGSFNQLLAGLESAPLVSLREGGGLVPAGVLRPLFDNVHDTTVGASASASASANADADADADANVYHDASANADSCPDRPPQWLYW